MDYNELKDLVGEDNAISVYDYFASYSIDNLVGLVLDTFSPSQLLHLAKQLREDVDDEQS